MTFYITKYALTSGIHDVQAKDPKEGHSPEMLYVLGFPCLHGEGREWHRTKEAAIERAEVMRKAKIASLKKQIAKLEALKFQP